MDNEGRMSTITGRRLINQNIIPHLDHHSETWTPSCFLCILYLLAPKFIIVLYIQCLYREWWCTSRYILCILIKHSNDEFILSILYITHCTMKLINDTIIFLPQYYNRQQQLYDINLLSSKMFKEYILFFDKCHING